MSSVFQDLPALVALIVDDDPSMRKLCRHVLEREGYHVAEARSGAEAISTCRAVQPDLIIIDVVLPGMDGLAVTQRLRSDPALETVPILMMSGLSEAEAVTSALERGADAFLNKPFTAAELMTRVRSISRLRRALKVLQRSNDHLGCQAHVLTMLHDFCTSLGQCCDEKVVLERTLNVAAAVMGCRRGAVLMVGPSNREPEVAASVGPGDFRAVIDSFKTGEGLFGAVISGGETIVVSAEQAAEKCSLEERSALANGSLIGVPMVSRGRVVGVLLLGDRIGGGPMTCEDSRYLELVVAYAAAAIGSPMDHQTWDETASCTAASR